jgi:nucleotide-binding universal stress UspA family protein
MSFSDILVFLDRSAHSAARLNLAAELAAAHDAGLIGLRVEVHPRIPAAILAEIPEPALNAQAAAIAADTARIERAFWAAVDARGLRSEWWLGNGAGGVAEVCRLARYANLTVVGPRPADGDEELSGDDLLHDLVLTSGRPVLVVPDAPPPGPIGRRVLIAWNGTREASRAVADALPLLRKAEQVTVVAVQATHDHSETGIGEVCRHLLRNRIPAEAKVLHSDGHDAGSLLLARAAEEKCDLVVMGAYGRSRMREVILGGATRHVLRHTAIPVLMAH